MSKLAGRKYKRLQPPEGLGILAQRVWKMIVDSLPPEHFADCDSPVLSLFCRHFVQHERAMQELEASPTLTIIAGNGALSPHPMVGTIAKFAGTLGQLGNKLRIVPQSRLATKEKASNPEFAGEKETDDDEIGKLFAV